MKITLVKGEFKPLKGKELKEIETALKARKKDVTMTIRVNSEDIEKIKSKAKKMGIKYQSYIQKSFLRLRNRYSYKSDIARAKGISVGELAG